MYITITIEGNNVGQEISLDENRNISKTLADLENCGMSLGRGGFVRSTVQERVLRTDLTFAEAGIVTGDRIIILG